MKRELHTIYIKHDSQFKTLSKIALSQLILKIVYLKGDGTRLKQIDAELSSVLSSPVSKNDIEDAISVLIKSQKLNAKADRYFIHNNYKAQLSKEIQSNKNLLSKVIAKYFSGAESKKQDIENWFNDAIICFFEKYSFEWFHQMTYKEKNHLSMFPNVSEIVNSTLTTNNAIKQEDKEWLKKQFAKFIDSDESDDSLLFWYYGISMFSSRLITARNYADSITIEMFKDSKFILDTNILMILDLEAHELSKSLSSLETILMQLNITPAYFYTTRDEYLGAMSWRRGETVHVFNNYHIKILQSSDCPFIQTALTRKCANGDDIERMFENLMDVPSKFIEKLSLANLDYKELNEEIERGRTDSELKTRINEVYKNIRRRNKREKALIHDAGIINGAQFLRRKEKCWIITNDSTMKRYAIKHCRRDENEIAIGLDVVLALMAVNSGGVNIEASNFAPLFKNLIKYSLIPESDAFEVRDLAFILRTNMKVNELSNFKVIEVARQVKRLRVAGEDEENIALFLRRFMEGDTISMRKEVEEALSKEILTKEQLDKTKIERDFAFEQIRQNRIGELHDKYDKELRNNRILILILPFIIGVITYFSVTNLLSENSTVAQVLIALAIETVLGLLPLIPINKKLVKKYSEYVTGINQIVEKEITELRNKANQ